MAANKKYMIGISWFILSLIISILNDTSMKHLGTGLPPMQVAFCRFAFGCVSLIPFMIFYGKQSFATSRGWIHFFRGLILFLGMSVWCYGLSIVPIATATLTTFTIPLFVLILAPFFLKEKVTPQLLFATLIGFSGAIIAYDVTHAEFDASSLILLISSLLFASLDIINKKFVKQESMLSMLFYSALVTMILATPFALYNWQPLVQNDIMILAYLGIGGNLILFCLLKAFNHVQASSVAPYRYLELIFSAASGFIIFNEIPSVMMVIGAALIIPSTLFITLGGAKKS